MYDETALRLAVLATLLVAARPADIFSKVPSDFHDGTKWVLVRDDNVPDPPPDVIQGDNNVQVLPVHQQPQHLHGQPHVPSPFPVHVPIAPAHVVASFPGFQHLQGQSQVPPSKPIHVPVGPVHQNRPQVPSAPVHLPGHGKPPKRPTAVLVTPKPKPKPKPKPGKNDYGLVSGDYDTEIVESIPGPPPYYPQYEYEHAHDYNPDQYDDHQQYPQYDDGQYHDDYKKPRK